MIIMRKEAGKDFKVLNLTDIQISYNDMSECNECYCLYKRTVKELIEKETPDLVTISGDLSYGDDSNYLTVYDNIGKFIESFNIPWAVVWGNHDNQGGTENICNIVKLFNTFPHFVYESGDKSLGNGNYVICVEESGKTVVGIIMMDTHDRLKYTDSEGETTEVWAKLTENQLDWYKRQIIDNDLNNTILITHIPIHAYKDAFKAAFPGQLDPISITLEQSFDPANWNEDYKDSFGVRHEDESSYPDDEGAIEILKKMNSTKLVLCGHDHVNCTSIKYQGIRLTYSLKTGSGCYWNKELNGGTVLQIHSDGTVDVKHVWVDVL